MSCVSDVFTRSQAMLTHQLDPIKVLAMCIKISDTGDIHSGSPSENGCICRVIIINTKKPEC